MDKAMHSEFEEFNAIIEAIENRCMAVDGPVTPTLHEATEEELSMLWALLKPVQKENQSLRSELQKQKELNAELVSGLELANKAFVDSLNKYVDWIPTQEINEAFTFIESLIKKSKES